MFVHVAIVVQTLMLVRIQPGIDSEHGGETAEGEKDEDTASSGRILWVSGAPLQGFFLSTRRQLLSIRVRGEYMHVFLLSI